MNDVREVIMYRVGIDTASGCAPKDMKLEDVVKNVNQQMPAGTTLRWNISKDPTFSGGEPNPCPCNTDPDSRVHYLFTC